MKSNKKIAIIGGGAAGLVSSRILSKQYSIDLFESSAQLGGHIRPFQINYANKIVTVDTAFLGFKHEVYPNFSNLLKDLDISTHPVEIFGSVHLTKKQKLFKRDHGIPSLEGQSSSDLAREYKKFLICLARAQKQIDIHKVEIKDYLTSSNISSTFIDEIVIPDISSIWGIQPTEAEQMSVAGAIGSLLTVGKGVHIIKNTTSEYLSKLIASIDTVSVSLNSSIQKISSTAERRVLIETKNTSQTYDAVLFACPADQAYSLLSKELREKYNALSEINYADTVAILHKDSKTIKSLGAFAGHFNYLDDRDGASVTWDYSLIYKNLFECEAFLTVGQTSLLESKKIERHSIINIAKHRHCVHTTKSTCAANDLLKINGGNNIFFCGSYLGLAPVHEAAITSAINTAQLIKDTIQ